jgi:hypothetical protein
MAKILELTRLESTKSTMREAATERNRRLGAVLGQRMQTGAFAACQDQSQNIGARLSSPRLSP